MTVEFENGEFEIAALFIMPLHGLFSAGFVRKIKKYQFHHVYVAILYFRSADQQAVLKPLKTYNSNLRCLIQRYLLFHNL